MKPIYIEDIDWSLTVQAFENGKKDSAESNLNFTHRLKGLWDTMRETCGREASAVIPHAYQDEPGLVARSITLIDKEMMKEIFNERLRDKKTGMITVYEEFQEEIMQYEQRNRAVNAMLGPGSSPTPPPARAPPPAGAGRGLGSCARAGRPGPRRSAPTRDRPRAWRRRPGSHSSTGARRRPYSGPRCGWPAETCQGHHATPAVEEPSLWLMQDATNVQEWEVSVRPEILPDELATVRQTVADVHVQRPTPRAGPSGTARDSRERSSL